MSILQRDNDFTNKDFDSLSARFQNALASAFPDWSEKSRANFGNILAEQPSHIGDVVLYYVDRAARESRIGTAQLRRSILGICKLIGFSPAGAAAASVLVVFTLALSLQGTLTLPRGTHVKTAQVTEPVRFQLLEDLVFLPGETVKTALVEHSDFATDSFSSTGLSGQRFSLKSTPYLDESAVIVAANGTYTIVSNFLKSSITNPNQGRDCVVVVDQADRATLRFGNGINGAIPVGTVTIVYKVGGGVKGRLEPNTLTKLDAGPFKDTLGNGATITVNNPLKTEGAADRLSVEQIRLLAPESIRVIERATAREDYEIVARSVAGVARSLHLTRNEDVAIDENAGITFIVPAGGGIPTQALLDLVLSRFQPVAGYPKPTHPKSNTYKLAVQRPRYLSVDVAVKIFKRTGVTGAVAKANILAALARFFAISVDKDGNPYVNGTPNPLIDFGWALKDVDGNPSDTLAYSDVMESVRDAVGVRKLSAFASDCTLNLAHADVQIGHFEFPILGEVTIVDGDTGATL